MKQWILNQMKQIEKKLDRRVKKKDIYQLSKEVKLLSCYSELLLILQQGRYMGK